ncbi:phage antirepressor Ant [Clostridium chromiireducens]|uniref:Phage antirepressor Ant n=1 Tax=Clostridium chromiireducens TaxID=225345 RepID=A0A964W3B8_9CLOT|nr:phage antirepressor KilAC domain-containing protein [Clostridium chromiireducens]MVX64988.1 phage antirepressor Ant [Clostridium chromiireducens]
MRLFCPVLKRIFKVVGGERVKNLQVIKEQQLLGKDFKVYGSAENPLFLAKDVAEWIDYSKTSEGYYNVSKMLISIDDDEKVTITNSNSGGNKLYLTEDGLYEVLMQSRKVIAKKFKKEVKAVLRQIRITGGYIPVNENMSDFEIMARALQISQNTILKKDEIIIAKDVELEDKSKFINQIAISENSLLVREVAKIACKQGIIIGEKRLWQKLRDWKMIFKNTTEPKQEFIDRGHFEIVEGCRTSKEKTFTYHTTKVTGKGQVYIIKKLLEESLLKETACTKA